MGLELKNNPTLKDLQDYVLQMKQERGFNMTDKFYECCLFAEECGEVISAIRKNSKGGSIGSGSKGWAGCGRIGRCPDLFMFISQYARY